MLLVRKTLNDVLQKNIGENQEAEILGTRRPNTG